MPLEQRGDEQTLLTTEEAQSLIELFAEREQARRAEADRLAAMPKLSDVAGLIGVPIEDLRPLLQRLRGELQTPALEGEQDVRMTQTEADRLMELYGQTEREREAELERRAQLTSIQEVAEGLQIPVEEAEALLAEVRKRREPPTPPRLSPSTLQSELLDAVQRRREAAPQPPMPVPIFFAQPDEHSVEQEEPFQNYAPWQQNQAGRAVAVCAAAILILTILIAIGSGMPTPQAYSGYTTAPAVPMTMPSRSGMEFRASAAFTYVSANGPQGQGGGVMYANLPALPRGWSLRLYDSGGVSTVEPSMGFAEQGAALEQVRECARRLMAAAPGRLGPDQSAQVSQIAPLVPASNPGLCSDLAGWMILEVHHNGAIRRVYLPAPGTTDTDQTDLERRFDYAFGGKGASSQSGFKVVSDLGCLPPPGITVTVFAYGHAYRAVGRPAPPSGTAYLGVSEGIERSVRNLVEHAAADNPNVKPIKTPNGDNVFLTRDSGGNPRLSPAGIAVNVYYTYGSVAKTLDGVPEALSSNDGTALARSLAPIRDLAQKAAAELLAGSRRH